MFAQTAERREFVDVIEALGTLQANESVDLTASVTETVSAVYFDDGEDVEAGQILVEMTSEEEHALLEEVVAQLEEAERQFNRAKTLAATGGTSDSVIDERRQAYESARARMVALESRLGDRVIKAPFSGRVGLREVSVGALVSPGTRITTLDDLDPLKLDFPVPSLFLQSLRVGATVEARTRAFPSEEFTATITFVGTRVDPVTRSVVVRARVSNPDGRLRPGMLMNVQISGSPRQSVGISEGALVPRGNRVFVYVVADGEDGPVAEQREVRIGVRLPGVVEVRDGLETGERVVTDGTIKVRGGALLKVLSEDRPGMSLREKLDSAS